MELLFAFDSFLFWTLAVVFLILSIGFVEYNRPYSLINVVLGTLLILQFGSDIHPFTWILFHPVATIVDIVAWVIIGTLWAVLKWVFFVYHTRDKYLDFRNKTIADWQRIGTNSEHFDSNKMLTETGERKIKSMGIHEFGEIPPKIVHNKARFILWMSAWPLSAAWTLINDPARRLYNFIYYRLAKNLQAISDRAFVNIHLP